MLGELVLPPKRRLFWVDNTIASFQSLQGALANVLDWTVGSADSVQKALNALRDNPADIVLIDYSMGITNGLTIIPDIAARKLANQIYVCSGFAYSDQIFRDIAKFGVDVEVGFVPKERLPGADQAGEVIQFGRALVAGDFMPNATTAEDSPTQPQTLMVNDSDFPTWDSYSQMDLRGRVALLQLAHEKTEAVQSNYFESGDFAVLFCGSWTAPIRRYKSGSTIPDEHEIVQIAQERGYAPFLFSYGGNIDDLTPCPPSTRLQDYYAIELAYLSKREHVHLDSGNPFSLFGYEWYLDNGWIDYPIIAPQLYRVGEMSLWGKYVKFRRAICLDNRGQSVQADVNGFAATEWIKHRVCVECPADCDYGKQYPVFLRRICRYRTGLLGRNFFKEIDRLVTLDANRIEVIFSKRV